MRISPDLVLRRRGARMKKKASKGDLAPRDTIPAGGFDELLREIKDRIQTGQSRAISAANADLVRLYWDSAA